MPDQRDEILRRLTVAMMAKTDGPLIAPVLAKADRPVTVAEIVDELQRRYVDLLGAARVTSADTKARKVGGHPLAAGARRPVGRQ